MGGAAPWKYLVGVLLEQAHLVISYYFQGIVRRRKKQVAMYLFLVELIPVLEVLFLSEVALRKPP